MLFDATAVPSTRCFHATTGHLGSTCNGTHPFSHTTPEAVTGISITWKVSSASHMQKANLRTATIPPEESMVHPKKKQNRLSISFGSRWLLVDG